MLTRARSSYKHAIAMFSSFSRKFKRNHRKSSVYGLNDSLESAASVTSLDQATSGPPRTHTSQSNYSHIHGHLPLNSRLDPDAPPGVFAPSGPTRRNRPLSRPRTFYRLLGFERDRDDLSAGDTAASPIALPQKALALLGIDEPACFRRPPLPAAAWAGADDASVDGYYYGELGDDNDAAPDPGQLYFRPQSLCSSLTTTDSGTSAATCATTVTETSPSLRSIDRGNTATPNSDTTFRLEDICMLNLEDSDDEESYYNLPFDVERKPAPHPAAVWSCAVCAKAAPSQPCGTPLAHGLGLRRARQQRT